MPPTHGGGGPRSGGEGGNIKDKTCICVCKKKDQHIHINMPSLMKRSSVSGLTPHVVSATIAHAQLSEVSPLP